jgi:hypothetical protein
MKLEIRMSGVGKCKRALSAELLNMEATPSPAWLEQAAEEGHLHEYAVKKKLAEEGYIVSDDQLKIRIDRDQYVLVGHIDGKVTDIGGKYPMLLEIKSMSEGEFGRWMRGRWEAFNTYATQVSLYMRGTGLNECMYYVKNRNTGYADRAIISAPIDVDLFLAQLDVAIQYVQSSKSLILEEFDPASIDCRRCRYRILCIPESKIPDEITKKDLDAFVELWRDGKAKADEGDAQMETAKVRFKEILGMLETEKLIHNKLSISTIHRKNESWNGKILKEFLTPEQIEQVLKITEVSYARIIDLNERYK